MGHLPGVDLIIDSDELEAHADDDIETALKLEIARELRPAVRTSLIAPRSWRCCSLSIDGQTGHSNLSG